MSSTRKQMKKMQPANKFDKKAFNLKQDENELSCSEDEAKKEVTGPRKRPSTDLEDTTDHPVGNGFQSMLEKFGVDISKAMLAKKRRLESLTSNYMKSGQHKLEHLWSSHQSQRQKLTQQYSQQVSETLQQWEMEAQCSEEQEERMNNLFKQQIKVLQQARATHSQKLQGVRKLYDVFVKDMEEMQKSHEVFLQGATQELKKEINTLQKKILMDIQQQEMATVRKSLKSMLF